MDALAPPANPNPATPELDISRISPTGSSVFAGRATPNSYVTVYENSTAVGTVKADENGEWSIVTEHRFASLEPSLTFKSADTPPPAAVAAAEAPAAKGAAASNSPEAVAKQLMSGFEKLVAEAREEAKSSADKPAAAAESKPDTAAPAGTSPATTPPATSAPPSEAAAPKAPEAKVAAAEPAQTASTPPAASAPQATKPPPDQVVTVESGETQRSVPVTGSASIPVPIMFVYNEATFTDEGRRAVDLLLEYLKLKHLESISLSGHADERGSDDYNMDLSRERLDAVARHLRDGGFSGKLDLVPKGKSEPFTGVDRTRFSGEALYQLDRRVELRVYR
jgi:outer membrane protein OmpA-like peptidoglycan-associated protein